MNAHMHNMRYDMKTGELKCLVFSHKMHVVFHCENLCALNVCKKVGKRDVGGGFT